MCEILRIALWIIECGKVKDRGVPFGILRPCSCLPLLLLDLRAGLEQLCVVHEWMLNTACDCCRIVSGRLDQERSDKDPRDYDSYDC